MQPSARQQELERLYQSRKNSKKHSPQLSISDDSHHVTEAIGSWYEQPDRTMAPPDVREHRPLSYINSPSERESFEARRQRRHGIIDASGSRSAGSSPTSRTPLSRTQSNERVTSPTESNGSAASPKSLQRMSSMGSENTNGQPSPTLSRQSSTDTAVQPFPLNDIDYESSPAAVQQELSNLQAIRRMSMNIDAADPDLPSFGNIPTVAPKSDDEDDPSKLFWVPARLHPELAPKEFKTFIEDRVDKIRRRSGDSDSLSPDGLDRSGSSSSLRRKKSMLSHQIDTKGNYEDGAERLERKKSKGLSIEGSTTVANLADLEELVNDPSQLVRRMSLDQARRSMDSSSDAAEDMPILPPGNTLKRSTRTTYRRGSLKKGERVPFSRRAAQRQSETDETLANASPVPPSDEPVILGLTRVQTEPTPPPSEPRESTSRPSSKRSNRLGSSQSSEDLPTDQERRGTKSPPPLNEERYQQQNQEEYPDERPQSQPPSSQQPKQFQSRIASPGRTTAQLPGYTNTNPLPQIIETLPDGSKVPVNHLVQQIPERKSSHEVPRQFQRGGAHMRPVPGREKTASSSLDDISSRPSPLPGSGSTRTDALTMVPTFEEKKSDKKDAPRKSSWKWILGNDEKEDKKSKDDGASDSKSSKAGKLSKASADKARLDVLQTSIDGTVPARGRESLVLNREDIKLEEERRKESKRSDTKKEKDKDTGLLSALFGGKKKTSDGDLKEKKKKADRNYSPEPPPRILKPDIDYNWTRFSILEERAIYRMAHIKLANPRRALYSQVLLSNFMYSYLAKVQMMHPQMQIPASQRAAQEKRQKEQEQQPPEYNQYQRWQEVSIQVVVPHGPRTDRHSQQQAREEAAQSAQSSSNRTSFDMIHGGQRNGNDAGESSSSGHDRRSSEEYSRQQYSYSSQSGSGHSRTNGNGYSGGNSNSGGGSGYSVASTHDYLGYSNNQQGLWEDEERAEELW